LLGERCEVFQVEADGVHAARRDREDAVAVVRRHEDQRPHGTRPVAHGFSSHGHVFVWMTRTGLPARNRAMSSTNCSWKSRYESALTKPMCGESTVFGSERSEWSDRKSTRLNSSHRTISYAVF